MNFIPEEQEENSAYIQLLRITWYALIGTVIGIVLSILILVIKSGSVGPSIYRGLAKADPAYLSIIRISQVLNTGFLFILPPIWLARSQKIELKNFYKFKRPQWSIVLLIFILMICSSPLMEVIGLANQKMVLPRFLKFVELWMRDKENEAMKMTILLLKIDHIGDFFINIFIIALLPAIGEELFFRGALQRSFSRMFSNPHVAIWVTAFIFSAIHLQFFGFFPRMFLGAAFGYIYLWTGSLWYTMFAHFLNNGFAVCQAWYLQVHHIPLDNADNSSNFPWYGYVISLILSIFLFKYLKDKTSRDHGKQLD